MYSRCRTEARTGRRRMIRSEPFAASEDRCVLILCEKKHLHAHTLVGGTSFSDVQCRVPVSLSELQRASVSRIRQERPSILESVGTAGGSGRLRSWRQGVNPGLRTSGERKWAVHAAARALSHLFFYYTLYRDPPPVPYSRRCAMRISRRGSMRRECFCFKRACTGYSRGELSRRS
jgi:hypothetical protein